MNMEKAYPSYMRKVRHSYTIYKPVSMIPADGWRAVYAYWDKGDEKYAHAKPLMALVLAEEQWVEIYEGGRQEIVYEGRRIMGYDPDEAGVINPANEATNFIAYLPPGASIPDSMEQEAKEYVLAHETTKETAHESP